jgi:hypothetical protein
LARKGLPGHIGISSARWGFFLRVSFVRGGIGVAAGPTKAGHFHFRAYPDEFNVNLISFVEYWEKQAGGRNQK